jgi:cobalt-zinc-cadmium efflux system membrane fusion protein
MNRIIIAILGTLFIFSCQKNTSSTTSKEEEEEHSHEESNFTSLSTEQIKAVGIAFGTIEQKQLTSTLKMNGVLRVPNNHKGNATALFGGVIRTLNVEFGDFVRKGQVIATIANPQYIQLQEEFLNIQHQITLAQQELQRQKELNDGNAGTQRNLQNATSSLNTLLTRKSSLHEQIRLMGINPSEISNATLKSSLLVISPISGTVSTVFAKIGSYVDVSSPVAEIVDNSSLHLDLQVFEKDLSKMNVGQKVHFTLTNNPTESYTAQVFNIGSSFENESKSISVHCNVIGNKKGLIDGMNISTMVNLSDQTSEAVVNDAIVEADGKYYIFIQKPDTHTHDEEENSTHQHSTNEHEFEKVEVVKGVTAMGYTAITPVSDIAKDAIVVTKGAFFINAKMSNSGGHAH